MVGFERLFRSFLLCLLCVTAYIPQTAFGGDPAEIDLRWKQETPWVWLRTPAVAESTFFLMVKHGEIAEISLSTGKVMRSTVPPEPGDCESPVLHSGKLYVACGNSNMTVFDASTLEVVWSKYMVPPDYDHGCNMHMEFRISPPAVEDSLIYFTSDDGYVYCLHSKDGTMKWKQNSGMAHHTPLVHEGFVYVAGGDSCLTVIRSANGEIEYKIRLGETVEYGRPKVIGNDVFMAGRGGTVFCINSLEGSFRWKRQVGSRVRAEISVTGKTVCLADASGLYMLDPGTGDLLWKRDLSADCPIQDERFVYCHTHDQGFLILDVSTGSLLGIHQTEEPGFFNRPVLIPHGILVCARGSIYCLANPYHFR